MTLLVHDEADIIDAQLAFHLNAGVDLAIVTDHRSTDGTTEILEKYARAGSVRLIREEREEYLESEWVTRMARLAATEHGADWVINSSADEFWWPRGHDLEDVLSAIPARYGVVQGLVRNFVPRPDDGSFFAERMTVRLSPQAPINDPGSPWRPYPKVAHRGDPHVTVARGSHMLLEGDLLPLRGWYPVEVLHFGVRSLAQSERKASTLWTAFSHPDSRTGTGYHARAYRALQEGRGEDYYNALVVTDEEIARGVDQGSLVLDTRLRDALRELEESSGGFECLPSGRRRLHLPVPSVVDEAAYAVDIAVLREADVLRARRQLDRLERRVAALERRPVAKVTRRLARLIRRRPGEGDR